MEALNSWNGGVIIISHDERFITNVAQEVRTNFTGLEIVSLMFLFQLWVCANETVSKFRGDVQSYKVRCMYFFLPSLIFDPYSLRSRA